MKRYAWHTSRDRVLIVYGRDVRQAHRRLEKWLDAQPEPREYAWFREEPGEARLITDLK